METIYDVPIILRREIEALMIKPFLDAFEEELGHEKTYEIASRVVESIAEQQGAAYTEVLGGNDLNAVRRQMEAWSASGALDYAFSGETPDGRGTVNLTIQKCQYTQMYERIGMKDLGALLSCLRDEAFYKGLNPAMKMKRTKTLMQNCDCCDFCLKLD